MIYSFDLKTALLAVGLLLIVGHVFALLQPKATRAFLQTLPRSRAMGFFLLLVVTVWAWLLAKNIDLGEFSTWRPKLLLIIPIAAVLTWLYVEEFLAARCLGMLVLLAAEPLLEAAFLRPEMSRLFLVTLVYAWVAFALFWVGMPYTLRDQISWVTKTESRWKLATFAGIAYGALLLCTIGTLGHAA